MRALKKIFVHCSAGKWGDVGYIDRVHRGRGWDSIGYHFVIENGYPTYNSLRYHKPLIERDGLVCKGRDVAIQGAHVKHHNADSIGICLIGIDIFTSSQIKALHVLISTLQSIYGPLEVCLHNEYDNKKTCPNLSRDVIIDVPAHKS